MDTSRVRPSRTAQPRRGFSRVSLGFFISGILIMAAGIMMGNAWIAAAGFAAMVISFLFLNSSIWTRYLQNTRLSQMLRDRGVRPSQVRRRTEY